jgi:hypothetical protein
MSPKKAMDGTAMNVTALISVATIEPATAGQGSLRPPRKKSRMVVCLPASFAPSSVVNSR